MPEGLDGVVVPAYAAFASLMSTMQLVLAEVSARTGLSRPALLAFEAIEQGATRVSDVADATNASPSATSRTVDGLVAAGLVERVTDPHDRRVQRLAPTTAGLELSQRIAGHVMPIIRRAVEDVGRERLDEVARTTAAVADRIAEILAE